MAVLQLLYSGPNQFTAHPQFARGNEEHFDDPPFDYTYDYTEDLGSPESISSSPNPRQTSRESTSPPAVLNLQATMTLKVLIPSNRRDFTMFTLRDVTKLSKDSPIIKC